jgi:hypothetical protein
MRIVEEESLRNFDFGDQASQFVEKLTSKELDSVEQVLEELYPDGMSSTDINDIFRFEQEEVCSWLGLDLEEVYNRE